MAPIEILRLDFISNGGFRVMKYSHFEELPIEFAARVFRFTTTN